MGAISMVLPQDVILGVQATPVAIAVRSKDMLAWAGTLNGLFSIHSAYALAVGLETLQSLKGNGSRRLSYFQKFNYFCGNAIIIVLELNPVYMLKGWAQTPIVHYVSKLLKLSSMPSVTAQLLNQFGIN